MNGITREEQIEIYKIRLRRVEHEIELYVTEMDYMSDRKKYKKYYFKKRLKELKETELKSTINLLTKNQK